jgi:pSer/pThr/pTyr-binding forkhead associated (FHA) protein
MNPQPVQIRLTWEDPARGEQRNPLLAVPIAFGRDFNHMPAQINGRRVSRIVLSSAEVSRFHALIDLDRDGLVVIDQNSSNGVFVNGQRQPQITLANGDTLQIGPYQITIALATNPATAIPSTPANIQFNPNTDIPDPSIPPSPPLPLPSNEAFPPPVFNAAEVSLQDLQATGLPVEEKDYVAVGAGLGSFVWVDLLRIYGAKSNQIAALGMEDKPYGRYQRLCQNSQIPPHERLRSNSDSCPDNIWGWPSYALRESWHDLLKGHLGESLGLLWQVFAEPAFAETYTPRSGNVFASLDREANRIGWEQIFRYGRVRAIRKTNDGRYAIAYSRSSSSRRDHAFLIARYVHLATGYPAIQFLPDLQAYREKTGDFKSVVNAYEEHNHVYEYLERQGGTVLIRGRGIVASRILQRLYEARQRNRNISVLHLMRSPKPQGNKFGPAQRKVVNHYEFQPFNWPKACWTGELRSILEKASPDERIRLCTDWGGTTTADRKSWQRIVAQGLKEGWYKIEFGEVERVEREPNGIVTYIQEKAFKGQIRLEADFIIDATGLDAAVTESPLLKDLVTHYNLPLNPWKRFLVANDFEIVEMRNQAPNANQPRITLSRRSDRTARMYAAGASTLGGPYAAVDSFLGLQYAALVSVGSLAAAGAPGMHPLNPVSSFGQWLKWVVNQSP